MKLGALWVALAPAVAAACPTCARDESPLRAFFVAAMVLAPLVVGAAAVIVLKRLGPK